MATKTTQAAPPPSSPNLGQMLDVVAKEKGIERPVLVNTIENAVLSAARKHLGGDREIVAKFNERAGAVDLFQYMSVVDTITRPDAEMMLDVAQQMDPESEVGDQLAFQVYYLPEDQKKAEDQDNQWGDVLKLRSVRKGFGRIAAQAAKQVLLQRMRDAEREKVYNEFKDRKGEIITGIVRRFERNDLIVDLGRTEAILRARDQVPRESYRPGERIVAFVREIEREAKGPQVILSRGDVGLLIKLFESEVPEIYEGIVKIVAAAREPGVRSKIAVNSRELDVDPVGACVGVKGSRVQAVVQELRGERIDIVPYDKDPARFVCNAIAPAEIARVIIREADHAMELVVPDEKLSLAIGRKGQNVRLASQLTGWKLDIVSESKFKQIEEDSISDLSRIEGVTPSIAQSMYKLGYTSLEVVAEANPDDLAGIPGLGGAENAERIKSAAEAAMEEQRQVRIREAMERTEALSERDRLLFVQGVGGHTIQLLGQLGIESVEDLDAVNEEKLMHETGLGLSKVRKIKQGARNFLDSEQTVIEDARAALAEAAAEEASAEEAAADATTETPGETPAVES